MMKFKLNEAVSSPQDLRAIILEIKEYARWFSHNAVKKRVGVKARHLSDEPELTSAASALLHDLSSQASITVKSLDDLLATLESYSKSAPQLTITLAAPPTGGLKKTLVAWCRENVSPNVLVNFQFNATLLGGMVIRSGSHVFDWSFRRQILEARSHFPEVLRRV